jgi:IclR family acetate operon transcriptional repressor
MLVLRAISEHPGGLSLQELVTQLGVPLASMHRLLTALDEESLVARSSATRRYVIGPTIYQLATGSNSAGNLAEVARPHLEQLRREVLETAFVSQLIGDKVVCVALAESTQQLRLFVNVGQEMPLHASAAARVILAHKGAAFARRALESSERTPFTNRTLTDVDVIMRHLPRVRRQGFDTCENEIDRDVWAVAAPIGSGGGDVDASVAIVAPLSRFGASTIRRQTISIVRLTARAIATELGVLPAGTVDVVTRARTPKA